MSNLTHEEADSALADSLWWFRGYVASRPADEQDRTHGLGDKLLNVRNWLKDLVSGDKRSLGIDDRQQAFVLTEAEFERVSDALHTQSSGTDREFASVMLRRIYEQVKSERALSAYDDEIPF